MTAMAENMPAAEDSRVAVELRKPSFTPNVFQRRLRVQAVSKRMPLWLSAKFGLSERSIPASRYLGRGKATP
jgi:hypothetical protein